MEVARALKNYRPLEKDLWPLPLLERACGHVETETLCEPSNHIQLVESTEMMEDWGLPKANNCFPGGRPVSCLQQLCMMLWLLMMIIIMIIIIKHINNNQKILLVLL